MRQCCRVLQDLKTILACSRLYRMKELQVDVYQAMDTAVSYLESSERPAAACGIYKRYRAGSLNTHTDLINTFRSVAEILPWDLNQKADEYAELHPDWYFNDEHLAYMEALTDTLPPSLYSEPPVPPTYTSPQYEPTFPGEDPVTPTQETEAQLSPTQDPEADSIPQIVLEIMEQPIVQEDSLFDLTNHGESDGEQEQLPIVLVEENTLNRYLGFGGYYQRLADRAGQDMFGSPLTLSRSSSLSLSDLTGEGTLFDPNELYGSSGKYRDDMVNYSKKRPFSFDQIAVNMVEEIEQAAAAEERARKRPKYLSLSCDCEHCQDVRKNGNIIRD